MATEERPYVTVEEVAAMVGVHPKTVRRWLREGRMHGTLLTRQAGYRIPRSEVERALTIGLREPEGKAAARPSLAAA